MLYVGIATDSEVGALLVDDTYLTQVFDTAMVLEPKVVRTFIETQLRRITFTDQQIHNAFQEWLMLLKVEIKRDFTNVSEQLIHTFETSVGVLDVLIRPYDETEDCDVEDVIISTVDDLREGVLSVFVKGPGVDYNEDLPGFDALNESLEVYLRSAYEELCMASNRTFDKAHFDAIVRDVEKELRSTIPHSVEWKLGTAIGDFELGLLSRAKEDDNKKSLH